MIGAGAVLGALKIVGSWVLNNPHIAMDAVDKVAKIKADMKSKTVEECLQTVDEKLNQLGAAALELDQKIDLEVEKVDTELKALRKQLRTIKIIMAVMGSVLGVAVILLAIF